MMVRGRQSRTKTVAAARAAVRKEQDAGEDEGGGATTEEERRSVVGFSESPVVQTSTEWGEDAIDGRCFYYRTWGEFEWTRSGRSSTCVRLVAGSLRSGDFYFGRQL
jgi:hypothetical protein